MAGHSDPISEDAPEGDEKYEGPKDPQKEGIGKPNPPKGGASKTIKTGGHHYIGKDVNVSSIEPGDDISGPREVHADYRLLQADGVEPPYNIPDHNEEPDD